MADADVICNAWQPLQACTGPASLAGRCGMLKAVEAVGKAGVSVGGCTVAWPVGSRTSMPPNLTARRVKAWQHLYQQHIGARQQLRLLRRGAAATGARSRPAAADGMVAARPDHDIRLSRNDVLRAFKRAGGAAGRATGKAPRGSCVSRTRALVPLLEWYCACRELIGTAF